MNLYTRPSRRLVTAPAPLLPKHISALQNASLPAALRNPPDNVSAVAGLAAAQQPPSSTPNTAPQADAARLLATLLCRCRDAARGGALAAHSRSEEIAEKHALARDAFTREPPCERGHGVAFQAADEHGRVARIAAHRADQAAAAAKDSALQRRLPETPKNLP